MRRLTRIPIVRKIGVPIYRSCIRQVSWLPGPKILVISMPKAGTHLVSRVLNMLPKVMFSGLHLSEEHLFDEVSSGSSGQFDQDLLQDTMSFCNSGQYMTGHLPAVPELMRIVAECGFSSILILRDPRDVVVSYVHYVTGEPRHFHHVLYNSMPSVSDRIMATIRGFSDDEDPSGVGLASIGAQIRRYSRWIDESNVLVCSFERLIGPTGGGLAKNQRVDVSRIASYVGRPLAESQLDSICRRTFCVRSRTFRRGVIGDWANHFTDQHVRAFKEIAGEELIELGYETSHDWSARHGLRPSVASSDSRFIATSIQRLAVR